MLACQNSPGPQPWSSKAVPLGRRWCDDATGDLNQQVPQEVLGDAEVSCTQLCPFLALDCVGELESRWAHPQPHLHLLKNIFLNFFTAQYSPRDTPYLRLLVKPFQQNSAIVEVTSGPKIRELVGKEIWQFLPCVKQESRSPARG